MPPLLPPRLRFAPSPNGPLHLGHALSALANAVVARDVGGEVALRVEDIDPARSRPEHVAGLHADLEWLGLDWAGTATRQSRRMALYAEALETLDALGLVYPCYATRGEIRALVGNAPAKRRDPDGAPLYPGLHKRLTMDERRALEAEGRRPALRLHMDRALARIAGTPLAWREVGRGPAGETGLVPADPGAWGDVVLARRDVPTSYHLAVVVDDADQGITHVVRGRDLFHATSIHRLLQDVLGLPSPSYRHHRLLLGPAGGKLSKSRGSPALADLRGRGVTGEALRDALLAVPLDGPDAPAPDLNPSDSSTTP